jgi:hypothetical protein
MIRDHCTEKPSWNLTHPDKLKSEISCLTSVGKYRGIVSVLDYVLIMVMGSEEGMVEMVSVNVLDNFLKS